MRDSWQHRLDRAAHLAERDIAARPLLQMYGRLLVLQRDCYETLRQRPDGLTGALNRDLGALRPCIAPMLTAVRTIGPPRLVDEARQIVEGGPAAIDEMLLAGWHSPDDPQFLAKLALHPYAQALAARGLRPIDRMPRRTCSCPFCAGAPQVSILDSGGAADGGTRQLLCAACATAWPFPRVRCAWCGEEDERQLGYYQSPAFDHLRVDACDTCRRYLKTVDLTRLGIAVPVVDEVAGAALDLWAREHGYQKIALNLVGL